jgi:microcystin-dependent protein
MSNPFVGEIRMFGGNFGPAGWALCAGQIMAIAQNNALFALIGTTYGGDGQQTYALPDLRGRVPLHQGSGFTIGQVGGSETVTLTSSQLPTHNHSVRCTDGNANQASPQANMWASEPNGVTAFYTNPAQNAVNTGMVGNSLSPGGGSFPHENMQPTLAVSFIIALFGIFPSQN